MRRLKKGDLVQIIAGRSRPQQAADRKKASGRVKQVLEGGKRVIVEGQNMVWRHQRRSQNTPKGSRHMIEAPLDASNVMLFDPEASRPVRIRYVLREEGDKTIKCRLSKASGYNFDTGKVEKPRKTAETKPAVAAQAAPPAGEKTGDENPENETAGG